MNEDLSRLAAVVEDNVSPQVAIAFDRILVSGVGPQQITHQIPTGLF
ncbi:hypothetical protein IU447_11495 [Nocardia farcinica]|nr:hypothetical protein [Nocardia farcinica]MBF6360742.1 hypothetical protein [Nocardia farcinica]